MKKINKKHIEALNNNLFSINSRLEEQNLSTQTPIPNTPAKHGQKEEKNKENEIINNSEDANPLSTPGGTTYIQKLRAADNAFYNINSNLNLVDNTLRNISNTVLNNSKKVAD
eukprot:486416_1